MHQQRKAKGIHVLVFKMILPERLYRKTIEVGFGIPCSLEASWCDETACVACRVVAFSRFHASREITALSIGR